MDNRYNYYVPNETEMKEDSQGKKPRKKYHIPKVLMIVCLAAIFGVVGGSAFLTTNYIGSKLLGLNSKQSVKETPVTKTEVTQTSSSVVSDVSKVVENVMPSVVSITNMSVQQVQDFFGGVNQQESESSGSGIIIGQNDTELLILSNNHVVEGSKTLTVSFIDGKSVEAQIKGTDAKKDLAVIAVNRTNIEASTTEAISVATLGDSTTIKVGEPVIAIGNALGYGQSVTTGVVSATNRTIQVEDSENKLIQTDAAINPGNSGGALLNINGEVIGINSAKLAASAVEGMGYAIPISDASETINALMNQETKTKLSDNEKGFIGIKGVDVTAESAQMYGMPSGVYVSEAIAGGGAAKAGIAKGSIITGLEGTNIDSMSTLQEQLQYYKKGSNVKITLQIPNSDGGYKEQTVEVTLGSAN
ncbi:MAG: trypsin-like peptidase domain-containing protein [Lachnospiraceae bacterium]